MRLVTKMFFWLVSVKSIDFFFSELLITTELMQILVPEYCYPKSCVRNQKVSQSIIIPSSGITSACLIKSPPRFNQPTLWADFANAKSGVIQIELYTSLPSLRCNKRISPFWSDCSFSIPTTEKSGFDDMQSIST